jgi:hypothetical protein
MTKHIIFFAFIAVVYTATAQNNKSIIAKGAKVQKLADGFPDFDTFPFFPKVKSLKIKLNIFRSKT